MNFVLVHGATTGGWIWAAVTSALRRAGHEVYAPTLTGLGERSHLLTRDVTLATHIQDVANILIYEDLRDVLLVGHSYGGIVVQGVAEQVPDRLRRLIFVDALILQDGEAMSDLYDSSVVDAVTQAVQREGEGWQFLPVAPKDERSTPHPFRTILEPLAIQNAQAAGLPRSYIRCTGGDPDDISAAALALCAARAQAAGWRYHELASDHEPMLTAPAQLATLLPQLA